jgi:hypothetical protein
MASQKTAELTAKAIEFQKSRLQMKEPLLNNTALGKKLGVSEAWVRANVPAEYRASKVAALAAGLKKMSDKPSTSGPAPASAESAAATAPKGTGSYTPTKGCGKGKHDYQDRGGYFKCSKCGSSKTKPK